MNITLGIVTIIILVFLVIRQISVWKLRVFLSPGFYFGFLWILGVSGILIFTSASLIPMDHIENMDEMMGFICFTAFCFLILTKKGYSTINKNPIEVNYTSETIYRILSSILLVAAIAEFMRLGSSTDMGQAREMVHDNILGRPTWINYAITLAPPLSIWGGYRSMNFILDKQRTSFANIAFLIMPLLANLIISVTLGGRVNFVYCFAYYLIGAALSLPINRSLKELKKPILYIACGAVLLTTFITAVASQRAQHYMNDISEKQGYFEENYGALSFLYGPIEYMTVTFIGYQYRRDDAVDLTKPGYGQYTLNGFVNWTIPFSGQFGANDASIAKALDIYYNNQETYDFERIAYNCTHSCYIPIVKDFGPTGAYAFIFVLVYIAHCLFIAIQRKKFIFNATAFYLFILFWEFWVKSNYYGTLSSSVLIPLYGFIIIDMLNFIFNTEKQS